MRISTMSGLVSDEKEKTKIKNKRKHKKGGSSYRCRSCQYRSNRQYNVIRHEKRIHQNVRSRTCCGLKLKTKYDWYIHCDAVHPDKRATSFTSKEKYQIIADQSSLKREYPNLRKRKAKSYDEPFETQKFSIGTSKRLKRAALLKEMGAKSLNQVKMEDVPLIYRIGDPELYDELQQPDFDMNDDETSGSESAEDDVSQVFTKSENSSSQEGSLTESDEYSDGIESRPREYHSHESLHSSGPQSSESSGENSSIKESFDADDRNVQKHWHEILRLNFSDFSNLDLYNHNIEHFNAPSDYDTLGDDKENCLHLSSHLPLKKRIMRREKFRNQNSSLGRAVEVQVRNEISLIEITDRQRDYVSFFDFERYKVL